MIDQGCRLWHDADTRPEWISGTLVYKMFIVRRQQRRKQLLSFWKGRNQKRSPHCCCTVVQRPGNELAGTSRLRGTEASNLPNGHTCSDRQQMSYLNDSSIILRTAADDALSSSLVCAVLYNSIPILVLWTRSTVLYYWYTRTQARVSLVLAS